MKLDDIKKENIFQTPSTYFEDLPSIIQAKAVQSKPEAWYITFFKQPAVKFALPVLLLLVVAVVQTEFFVPNNQANELSAIELMDEVSTEEMYAYLIESSDITHEELLEVAVETQVELSGSTEQNPMVDEYLEDIDLEELEELL